jgi:hypothetical protein
MHLKRVGYTEKLLLFDRRNAESSAVSHLRSMERVSRGRRRRHSASRRIMWARLHCRNHCVMALSSTSMYCLWNWGLVGASAGVIFVLASSFVPIHAGITILIFKMFFAYYLSDLSRTRCYAFTRRTRLYTSSSVNHARRKPAVPRREVPNAAVVENIKQQSSRAISFPKRTDMW